MKGVEKRGGRGEGSSQKLKSSERRGRGDRQSCPEKKKSSTLSYTDPCTAFSGAGSQLSLFHNNYKVLNSIAAQKQQLAAQR